MFRNCQSNIGILTAAFLMLTLIMVSTATADTLDVAIAGFAFDPQTKTINLGTTVRWTNNDAVSHTSTSDSPYWDSGTLTQGADWSFTFDSLGVFPYHCGFHPTMLGTLIVIQPHHIPSSTPFGLIILALLILVSAFIVYRKKRVLVNN